jgi:hypothetical protein
MDASDRKFREGLLSALMVVLLVIEGRPRVSIYISVVDALEGQEGRVEDGECSPGSCGPIRSIGSLPMEYPHGQLSHPHPK